MNWKAVSDYLLGDANYYDLKARRAPCPTERDAHTATANTLRSLGNALLAGLVPGTDTRPYGNPMPTEAERQAVLRDALLAEKAKGYENP